MEELCTQLEWSLLNAASSFSSFAGLAASLILASMVIIVVQYEGVENPTAAVALFTVALLALGMDTFIFGAVSGEVLCARGDAHGLLGGSTMATGVAILLLGVTLLQAKFDDSLGRLTLLGNVVTSLGAGGVLALLALWTVRPGTAGCGHRHHMCLSVAHFYYFHDVHGHYCAPGEPMDGSYGFVRALPHDLYRDRISPGRTHVRGDVV